MRTIDQMIDHEILTCVSTLVYDLTMNNQSSDALVHDLEQEAIDLWAPVIDDDACEECARDDGWDGPYEDGFGATFFTHPEEKQWACPGWRELCDDFMLEPSAYAGEVFEHWAVTGWLADKLEAAGERVVRDWHGLTIWARTTTGQSISMDHVIQEIYEEAHK